MKYKNLDSAVFSAEKEDISVDILLNMVQNKSNFLTYEQLENINDIEQVLGKHGCCIILYQNKRFDGHYCCLFKSTKKDTLTFFDPYGSEIDSELKYSEFNLRRHNNFVVPHLSSLIANSHYTVKSNKFQFQADGTRQNECGAHVAVRINLREYSNIEYIKFLTTNRGHQNPDFIVTSMTLLFRQIF